MGLKKRKLLLLPATALAAGAAFAAVSLASPSDGGLNLTNVLSANTKSDGFAPASVVSPELTQTAVAQGSTKLENPSALTSYYGYDNDVLNAAGQPQMLPLPGSATEAQKTEPDKNTYLVFKDGLKGADPDYNYGSHFLFQGHELGVGGAGYITRINLDADAAHRVTLLATTDVNGKSLSTIDGSTWIRGRGGCCSPPRTRMLRPTRPRPATPRRSLTSPELWDAAALRVSRTTRPATCRSSRTSAARSRTERPRNGRTASSTATCRPRPEISAMASLRHFRC